MTTLHFKKSMGRSPSRLGLLLIPVVFACFAFAQSARAVGPEPNEGDLIVNMAEEDDAVAELGSDAVEAATGQAANTPNKRVINFNIKKSLQCAGGDVILRGNVVVTFKHTSVGVVQPASLKLEGFTGTAKIGNRKLVAKNLKFTRPVSIEKLNGHGEGGFSFQFHVTGPRIGAGSPLRILVRYPCGEAIGLGKPCPSPNRYIFEDGKVTKVIPAKPKVDCIF